MNHMSEYPHRKFLFISAKFLHENDEEISAGMIPWNSPINPCENLGDVDGSTAGSLLLLGSTGSSQMALNDNRFLLNKIKNNGGGINGYGWNLEDTSLDWPRSSDKLLAHHHHHHHHVMMLMMVRLDSKYCT